jgi:hypothetical protein
MASCQSDSFFLNIRIAAAKKAIAKKQILALKLIENLPFTKVCLAPSKSAVVGRIRTKEATACG